MSFVSIGSEFEGPLLTCLGGEAIPCSRNLVIYHPCHDLLLGCDFVSPLSHNPVNFTK